MKTSSIEAFSHLLSLLGWFFGILLLFVYILEPKPFIVRGKEGKNYDGGDYGSGDGCDGSDGDCGDGGCGGDGGGD